MLVDEGGKVVIKQNLTSAGSGGFDKVTNFLGNLNSPTINNILSKVNGPDYKIYVNSFSDDRSSVNTSTKSNIGRKGTLESEWKNYPNAAGLTLQPSNPKNLSADILLSSESLETVNSNESFNIFETAASSIIDEFNHSLNNKVEKTEHINLKNSLQKELDNGTFNDNPTAEKYIPWLIQNLILKINK